jgi:TRAP transporter TAXI family solute receptor
MNKRSVSRRSTVSGGSRRTQVILSLILAALFLLTVAFPGAMAAEKLKRISIAAGGTGGVWYPYSGAMAAVISKYMTGVEATAEVTAAAVDNAKLLGAGKADLGIMLGDVGYDAYTGKGVFKNKIPIRNIAGLYSSITHIVTVDGKGIKSVADLKGKRVSVGAPGSATEVVATRILEAFGLDIQKDVKRDRLSVAESAGALKDGKIDAFFWVGGIPTAAVLDVAASPGMKIRLLSSAEVLPKMVAKYGPIYFKTICPPNTYKGVDYPVATVCAGNFLITHEKMDDKFVYDVLKTLFDHKAELVAIHKVAQDLTLDMAVEGSPFPFHPGALKYYKEKGKKIPK